MNNADFLLFELYFLEFFENEFTVSWYNFHKITFFETTKPFFYT